MDRKQIESEHIVARYLAGQLSPEEADAFEAYYTQHPSMVREIEYSLRLKEGLATLRDRQQLEALVKARRGRWALPLSIAAAVVAAALGTWTWYGGGGTPTAPVAARNLEELIDGGKATLPVAGKYMLVRVRSAEQTPLQIPLPSTPSALELQVLPSGGAAGAPYRFVFARSEADGKTKPLADLGGLVPGSDGLVAAWLVSERIQRGRYTVELSSAHGEAAAPAERFVIELE